MVTNLLGANQALDSSLNTIISRWEILKDWPTVFEGCATTDPLDPHTGTSKLINNYNRLVAQGVADGADIAQAQALSDTTTTITPGEVAVQTWLPGSTMRRIADPNLLDRTTKILMNALNLKIDQDGGAQMTSWGPTTGAAGRVLGPGEYLAAISKLQIGNSRANPEPAPEPYNLVDHPLKLQIIAGRTMMIADTGVGTSPYNAATTGNRVTVGPAFGGGPAGGVSEDIFRNGSGALGQMFGAVVKRSANLPLSGTADATGGVFSKEGLIYVPEVPKKIVPDNSDKSYRDAVELNGWTSYAFGLFRSGAYGVELIGDAALPTT